MSEVQHHTPLPSIEPPETDTFERRLRMVTLSLLLVWLAVHFLREYQTIFQPLLVAMFIGYLVLPLHHWLVERGVPAVAAYVLILLVILGLLFGVGILVYHSFEEIMERLPEYEGKVDAIYRRLMHQLGVEGSETMYIRDLDVFKNMGSVEQVVKSVQRAVGTFANFFAALAVTFVYLVFLVVERESLHARLGRAVGPEQARHMLQVAGTINRAITQYLAVKSLMGLVAAVLSMLVLAVFGVDFVILWGILIFILNYIPYLGSLVAVLLPIALAFVQLDSVWQAVVVALLLVAIQQALGTFLEPRMAGRRLDVSPLLILLSLSFWGVTWGVVGMILAVPLLVAIKTVLENINATRPLATMLSNQA